MYTLKTFLEKKQKAALSDLATFAGEISSSSFKSYALEASETIFIAAAWEELTKQLLKAVEETNLEDVKSYLITEVTGRANSLSRSTSPTANLMQQCRLEVRAATLRAFTDYCIRELK